MTQRRVYLLVPPPLGNEKKDDICYIDLNYKIKGNRRKSCKYSSVGECDTAT